MTLKCYTFGEITADESTLNSIACRIMEAQSYWELKAEICYNEADKENGDVYKNVASIYQKDIDIIYNALKAIGYYDWIKEAYK